LKTTAGGKIIPQVHDESVDEWFGTKGTNGVPDVKVTNLPATQAVTVADGANVAQGTKADAAVTNPALSASEIALLKGLLTVLQAGIPTTSTVSGTVSVNPLPAGTANIGDVDVLTLPALPAGTNNIGHVTVDNFPATQTVAGAVTATVANFPATQPVSGTVTANIGATNGVKNVDGSGTELFTAANPANVTLQASAASGAAVPSKIVQVGGVNSGNLYALTLDSANRLIATFPTVEGTAGQAAPTKFLMLGATDGTNAQALKVDAQKNLLVGVRNSGGGEMVANATGNGHNGSAALRVASSLYNGTSFDFQHANTEGTLLASAARTATTSSANQTNYNARGVIVTLRISAASGTGGLSWKLYGVDPVSGATYQITPNIAAPITAAGTYAFEVYPGSTTTGSTNPSWMYQRTSAALPRTWQLQVVHADGSSYTYSVGYQYVV
jgi:hypothetical protein